MSAEGQTDVSVSPPGVPQGQTESGGRDYFIRQGVVAVTDFQQ